jgi:hypothetical protein
MNETIKSINGVPIRLNAERWMHITMGHPEVAAYYDELVQTLEMPETVYVGSRGESLAVSSLPDSNGKNIIVVYREVNPDDGFVITAYTSSKVHELQKRTIVWQRQN